MADDLYDPDQYVAGVPHALLARLRREEPVFWQELPAGRGFWALLKHADVLAASIDPLSFSAARGGISTSRWPRRFSSGNRRMKAASREAAPVRSSSSAGAPVASTRPPSIAASQSKRAASSM